MGQRYQRLGALLQRLAGHVRRAPFGDDPAHVVARGGDGAFESRDDARDGAALGGGAAGDDRLPPARGIGAAHEIELSA